MPIFTPVSTLTRLMRPVRISFYALLLALACILLSPLTALACGGLFSADSYTEQSAERLIFAVDPGKVTLYEQIHYTGSPASFAWVLPVPAIPTVATASVDLFRDLDRQTAPRFYQNEEAPCGGYGASAPAPASGAVNVYSSGAVGPYSYNVISSNDQGALTNWLTAHHYKIPAEAQAEMQPYIAAHMFFLAMRLQGNVIVQDMAPVKITYATSQPGITIPLRMATPMGKENLQVLVWIFGQSRYIPQNYQSLQLDYSRLGADIYRASAYSSLVGQAVDKVGGHGFVTEYAQPTGNLYANDPELSALAKSHPYVTRMFTSIAPSQITLDPAFVAAPGQPAVSPVHQISNPPGTPQPVCPPSALTIAGIIGAGVLVIIGAVVWLAISRRKRMRVR